MNKFPSISNKPLIKVLAITGLIIFGFWIASFFPDLVLTLVISALLAFVLRPLVRFLEYYFNMRRGIAIAVIFLTLAGIATAALLITVPIFVAQMQIMYDQLKVFPFEEKLTVAAREIAAQVPFLDPSSVGSKVHYFIGELLNSAGRITGTIATYLVNLAIIPFVAYFMLAEGDIAVKKLVERIPNKYFEMSLNIMDKLGNELVFYLRGLLLECSIVGGLSTIGFMIIGIPYAVLLGIIAGIANLIPYLGFVFAACLAVIASLTKTGDFSMLLHILILSGCIRLIDDLILQPLCFGKSLNMHPVAVVLVLIIGHQLMGIAGMVISIPVATILRVSATEAYWGLKHYTITA
jgi:putative permease